jgi:DNA-directed RNA polymerase specialized sigma24 family protein
MVASSGNNPLWWDREIDGSGRPLRSDVRASARTLWDQACARARTVLGDPCETAELMERSVSQVSRYLDRRGPSLGESDITGLLMVAFCRVLRRYANRLNRIKLVPDISKVSQPAANSNGPSKECLMDAERAARHLNPRAKTMLDLRRVGFEWKEIAEIFRTTDGAARAEFSREVKEARARTPCTHCGSER